MSKNTMFSPVELILLKGLKDQKDVKDQKKMWKSTENQKSGDLKDLKDLRDLKDLKTSQGDHLRNFEDTGGGVHPTCKGGHNLAKNYHKINTNVAKRFPKCSPNDSGGTQNDLMNPKMTTKWSPEAPWELQNDVLRTIWVPKEPIGRSKMAP